MHRTLSLSCWIFSFIFVYLFARRHALERDHPIIIIFLNCEVTRRDGTAWNHNNFAVETHLFHAKFTSISSNTKIGRRRNVTTSLNVKSIIVYALITSTEHSFTFPDEKVYAIFFMRSPKTSKMKLQISTMCSSLWSIRSFRLKPKLLEMKLRKIWIMWFPCDAFGVGTDEWLISQRQIHTHSITNLCIGCIDWWWQQIASEQTNEMARKIWSNKRQNRKQSVQMKIIVIKHSIVDPGKSKSKSNESIRLDWFEKQIFG